MNLFEKLNKYFEKYLKLIITQMSVNSLDSVNPWQFTSGKNGYTCGKKRQEIKLELIPVGSFVDRTYNITLAVDDDYFKYDEILFDSVTANIPSDIIGYDRVVMRLGYMIYQGYLATKGTFKNLQDYPSYLVYWNVSSRA